ncbi:MAG: glutamate synthase-related protein, partial [Methanothrix sp.]|nr:glutamate synthase-related protein [Methanothrix sp.]
KPISVKIAAVHNFAAIASGIVRAGADIIAIDGLRGGTGAAPKAIRDNVGIPIELAISSLDRRLRSEGIRNRCSIIAAGGIRCSSDVIKAIALGADAVYIGSAALIAMGCTLCQKCYTGKCNWGICSSDPRLSGRLNVDIASQRLQNLISAWSHEVSEMLGGMGINALESLRGNRDHLRGVGLHEWELDVLGIKGAGE